MAKMAYTRWLTSLIFATGLASASVAGAREKRDAVCSGDNLLNKFSHTSSEAIPFCQTYIGAYTYQTVTVTTDYDSTKTATPTVTMSPGSWLPQTFPPARLSSACSCLSVPRLTEAVTVFIASQTSTSVNGATSTSSTASSTAPSTVSPSAAPTGIASYAPLGCFAEPAFPARALSLSFSSNNMTQDNCLDLCSKQGSVYAGLEFSSDCRQECWCGNSLNGATAINATQCNAACTVGTGATCGGSRALQLYGPPAIVPTSTAVSSTTSSVPTTCNPHTSTPTSAYNFKFQSASDLISWRYQGSAPDFKPLDDNGANVLVVPTDASWRLIGKWNLIRGATYRMSMRIKYSGATNIYGDVQSGNFYRQWYPTSTAGQWQTLSYDFPADGGLFSIALYIMSRSGSENVILISDFSLTALTTGYVPPAIDPASEMILIDWRNGSMPAPTATSSSLREASSDLPDVIGPVSPGYGAAAYAHQIDFTPGTSTIGYYTFQLSGVQVSDAAAQYIAKIWYKSTDSDQCTIQLTTSSSGAGAIASGCTDEWSELVSMPLAASNTVYYGMTISCFKYDQSLPTAKFWLDSLRLYKVMNGTS